MNNPSINVICVEELSNCYIVADTQTKEAVIIDAGVEPKKIINIIKENNYKVCSIINTHGHIDHTYSDYYLAKEFNTSVFVHEADKFLLNLPYFNLSTIFGLNFKQVKAQALQHTNIIKTKTLGFKILHTPGHTPGSICILEEKNKLLFSGDTLFKESIGRTDLYGGDYKLLLKSIKERLLTLTENYTIYPGHGNKTSLFYEKQNNPFISSS
jgi:glyoxylase-like metal-dependent hydrolase (beta-lactamase superfamily II)